MSESVDGNLEVTFLLVEDDEIDALALERMLRRQNILNPVIRARHGVEALELLRKPGAVPRPFLILLDLNLPMMNGIEMLEELRADPGLHDSVVFVLSTSYAAQDKAAAYAQHVAGYLVKRNVGGGLASVVGMLNQYCRVAQLPISIP